MADRKQASIGGSTSYTIGGKEYDSDKISQLHAKRTLNAKVESEITGEAVHSVKNQTESYRETSAYGTSKTEIHNVISGTVRLVDEIKTTTRDTSYKTQSRLPENKYISTGNIKTGSVINEQSVQAVKSQMNAFQKIPITRAVDKVQSTLVGQQQDLGIQSAGASVRAGIAATETFKVAQKATDAIPVITKNAAGAVCSMGKGVYQIGLTSGLAAVTISRTASIISTGQFIPIKHSVIQIMKTQAVASGLNKTAISRQIIHAVSSIQTRVKAVQNTANQIKIGYYIAKNAGINIVRGVTNGTITVVVAKNTIKKYSKKIVHVGAVKLWAGVKYGAKLTGKGIIKGTTKGIPFVTKTAAKGVVNFGLPAVGSTLTGMDNYALQGVGHAATLTNVGIKTGVTGIKVSGYTVKTMVKGTIKSAKGVYSAGKFVRDKGLRAAWEQARKKAVRTMAKAGQSIVSLLIEGAKAFGKKLIVPLILIAVVCMGFSGIIMAPISAITTMFGSVFSEKDTNTDYDVRDFLSDPTNGIPHYTSQYKQDFADQMANSWKPVGSYDIVRFNTLGNTDMIEPTIDGVLTVFPTDEQIINMVQPLYNAVLLMEYDLEPTNAQAKDLLKNIFDNMFSITSTSSIEQCGQDLSTGEGTVIVCSNCRSVHALSGCPNARVGTHLSYTCPSCCSLHCPGHRVPCFDPLCTDEHITYCSGCVNSCSGFIYCNGHDVITHTLSIDGIYGMVAEYFTNPINELSNINPRTTEQENQLQLLKDYYDIFGEMMSMVTSAYGGGLTMADLNGINFLTGTRTGNHAVIDLALSQVGQLGGQPYWSYYGFGSRVEWCACFVHWCMRNTPSATGSYPTTSNNAYCQTVANNFKSMGQWGDNTYTNLAMGDTIFFDWDIDGHTDHIGLVIGKDAEKVYTVEGNSGDAVKIRSYPLGSRVIYGYGLMNY